MGHKDEQTSADGSESAPLLGLDQDRIIESLYEAAVLTMDWAELRSRLLAIVCDWVGAESAAWLMRARSDLPGELVRVPNTLKLNADALGGVPFASGRREAALESPIGEHPPLLAMHFTHRGTPLQSVLALRLPATTMPMPVLRRVLGHMVQAATLALRQYVYRDEWLAEMGRSSRGCAALIDGRGSVYFASQKFREMLGITASPAEFTTLPFALGEEQLRGEDFKVGSLHLRARRQGNFYLVNARRPHPLDELSQREQEIARALALGKTFKTVARENGIAISTVANHASRIYRKLGIFRREELVELLRAAS